MLWYGCKTAEGHTYDICRNMSLSRELLCCDAAFLCRLRDAHQANLSPNGKVLNLFLTFYGEERSKREEAVCSCLIIFVLLIFQPQTLHLWVY